MNAQHILLPHQLRRLGRTGLILAVAVAGGYFAEKEAASYAKHYYRKNIAPLIGKEAKFHDINSVHGRRIQNAIDAELGARAANPLYKTANKALNVGESLEKAEDNLTNKIILPELGFKDKTSKRRQLYEKTSEEEFQEQQRSYVGNIGNQKNQPEWFIKSFGGMDSTGYWANNTSNLFERDPLVHDYLSWYKREASNDDNYIRPVETRRQFKTQRDHLNKMLSSLPRLPLPDKLDLTQPHLQVKRYITLNTAYHENHPSTDAFTDFFIGKRSYTAVNIPVLEGTKPVAAKFLGELPLNVYKFKAGNYALVFQNAALPEGAIDIEYWLYLDNRLLWPEE